jgi:phage terminase Nu1 subunit (DNA packaging protein)
MARPAEGRKVNRSELSVIFGVSLPTVDTWIRQNCPGVKVGAGKGGGWTFDTAEVSLWLQKRAADDAGGAEVADENALKRRRMAVTLKSDELALARDMGEVVPIDQVKRLRARSYAMMRQTIMTVPSRVAMSLVGEKSEIRIKQVIAAELTDALNRFADQDIELSDDEGEDGDE